MDLALIIEDDINCSDLLSSKISLSQFHTLTIPSKNLLISSTTTLEENKSVISEEKFFA